MHARQTIRPLTALRFVAALLVFADHAPLTRAAAQHLGLGVSGVGFFFVLSGFILARGYAGVFQRLEGSAVRSFYAARFARIYPVHLITLAVMSGVLLLWGLPWWTATDGATHLEMILGSVTLTQSWFAGAALGGINIPAWSLSDEVCFYAVFPFILSALAAAPRRRLLCYAALAWVGLIVAVLHHGHADPDSWVVYTFPVTRLIDFLVGVMIGLVTVRPGRALPGGTSWELAAIVAVGSLIVASPHVPNALRPGALLMPAWALLIVVFSQQRGRLSAMLSQRWCVRLGEASFAFYLLQFAVIEISRHIPFLTNAARSGLAFAIAIGASLLMFRFVEEPMRVHLHARLTRRRGTAAVPSVA